MESDKVLRFLKNERLKKGDFRGTQWIKCSETTLFSLLIHKNKYESKRIAVTIRKRVGNAVIRNRMRRLVKECFRLDKELFVEGCDNLIKVKRVPQKPTLEVIRREMNSLLSRGKAYKNIE